MAYPCQICAIYVLILQLQLLQIIAYYSNFPEKHNLSSRISFIKTRRRIIGSMSMTDYQEQLGKAKIDKMIEKAKKGEITTSEIDRALQPPTHLVDSIKSPLSKGFMGVALSLEGSLVNANALFALSFVLLAQDLKLQPPHPKQVNDLIGIDFSDLVLAIGWPINKEDISSLEPQFFKIMEGLIDKYPVERRIGADKFINSIISDRNEVTVYSSLPRKLAVKLLRSSGMSTVFEGRISPDHLVTYIPPNYDVVGGEWQLTAGRSRWTYQLLQCCLLMRKSPTLSLLIDSSHRNILSAKRSGLSCISLKGSAGNTASLRPADYVADDFSKLTTKILYQVGRKALIHADGPEQQTSAVISKVPPNRLKTAAYMEDNNDIKDTFADELGSDQF